MRVGVARVDGSGLRLLAATPDQQPSLISWVSDRMLLVGEAHRTTTALLKLPVDGGEPRRFDEGARVLGSVTLNGPGTRLAMVTSGPRAAPEAAVTATRRFRLETVSRANALAAAALAPITDLATLSNTTDLPGAVEGWLDGSLWERPDLYREWSPLWRADAITTPPLVLIGTDDARVPPDQGVALHRALARRGIDTRLVRFPRAGHRIDAPAQRLSLTREVLAWLARHL